MPPEKVPDEPPVLGAGILNGQTIKHFQGHLILQDCGVLMPEKKTILGWLRFKDFEGTSQKPLGKKWSHERYFWQHIFSQWNHFLHHFQLGGVFWGFFAFTFELGALWIGCPLASHHHAMQKRSREFKTLMWESKSDQTAWWDCWLMFLCRPFRKCSWLMFRAHDHVVEVFPQLRRLPDATWSGESSP